MKRLKQNIRVSLIKTGLKKPTIFEIYYGFENNYSWAEVLR